MTLGKSVRIYDNIFALSIFIEVTFIGKAFLYEKSKIIDISEFDVIMLVGIQIS